MNGRIQEIQMRIGDIADMLYDAGWRAADRELMIGYCNLAEDEADDICKLLAEYENADKEERRMSNYAIRARVSEHDIKIYKGNWTITEQRMTDADEIWILRSCLPGCLQINIMQRHGPAKGSGLMSRSVIDCLESVIVSSACRQHCWMRSDRGIMVEVEDDLLNFGITQKTFDDIMQKADDIKVSI